MAIEMDNYFGIDDTPIGFNSKQNPALPQSFNPSKVFDLKTYSIPVGTPLTLTPDNNFDEIYILSSLVVNTTLRIHFSSSLTIDRFIEMSTGVWIRFPWQAAITIENVTLIGNVTVILARNTQFYAGRV